MEFFDIAIVNAQYYNDMYKNGEQYRKRTLIFKSVIYKPEEGMSIKDRIALLIENCDIAIFSDTRIFLLKSEFTDYDVYEMSGAKKETKK